MSHCHVATEFMGLTSENRRREEWQATQHSNTCFQNAMESVSWYDETLNPRSQARDDDLACLQREVRSLVLHQRYTLHGLRGSGAIDQWLQFRDLPQLPVADGPQSERSNGTSHFEKEKVEGALRSAQRRRATELCIHCPASLIFTFTTL